MAQEFESPGSEYNQPGERRETDELRAPAPETAAPAAEFGVDRKSVKSAAERKAQQKEKQKKRHKLLKKMVYAAASAVAVVGLSQSVGTQSAAGTYAVYIGTDGIFPYYEGEDNGAVESYIAQTKYYYYNDYEISEYTRTVVDSHEGMDFEYEVTSLPMSALEKRAGISFDAETYTLTLEDYTNTILYVTVSETNEENTLTIRMEGTNELGFLHIAGVEHVIFSGTGSLDVVGIHEHYNVAAETYEEVNDSGDIIVLAEEAGYYPKVFVEDECRLTAGTMTVYSLAEFPNTPVSGNLQWAETSEFMSEEADWYNYACRYYDIAPSDGTLSDASAAAANEDATLTDVTGEVSAEQSEEIADSETTGESGTSTEEERYLLFEYVTDAMEDYSSDWSGYRSFYFAYSDGYEIEAQTVDHKLGNYDTFRNYYPVSDLEQLGGVSFDAETETLTFQDFDNEGGYVLVGYYPTEGDGTLTIQVNGTNSIGKLEIYAKNVVFAGTGSLETSYMWSVYNLDAGDVYEPYSVGGGSHIWVHLISEEDAVVCEGTITVEEGCTLYGKSSAYVSLWISTELDLAGEPLTAPGMRVETYLDEGYQYNLYPLD